MAGKYSAKGTIKMEGLEDAQKKMERVSSLIEQYAVARSGQDQFLMNIIRTSTVVQRTLMTAGYGAVADSANQIVMASRRGGTPAQKARNLREFCAAAQGGIERAIKSIMTSEREARDAKKAGG